MTFQEIQEKLKKCELALTSIKDGTYSNTNFTKEEALEKFTTIKESLEKKLNLLKEEETMFVSTKGGDTKAVQMDTKAAMDLKKDPNITGITTAKGKDLKEDDLSDEEQEEITTETSHTEVVAKEVHKALIEALQETGHEVSEDNLSSLNPETFTITVRFKDNTQSDYSFEFIADEVKLDGNIIVTTNKKGVTPILNKTIAKDNLVKYFKNLSEKKGKDLDGDGDVDSDDYMIARDRAIKANMKEEESEPVADKKGKYTGVRRLKLSAKDKETLKKIEALLAKEKNEIVAEAYKPKHFDICPGAEALRDELLKGDKTEDDLSKWTELNDQLFALEKKVLKDKEAKESDVKKAEDLRSQIINLSRELGIAAAKVGYLKGHVDKIKKHSSIKEELEEAPHQTAYLKVPLKDAKKALRILYNELGGDFIDVVDNDGAGNLLVYIVNTNDNLGTAYDAVMDLQAHDIEVVDHNADMDEDYDPDQEQKDDEEDHGVAYDDDGRPLGEIDETLVDYDFSKEELIRVIKQLKRGASTEIGMIKAFEKALGRELTDDEIRGFKIDPSKVGKASLGEAIDINDPALMRARVAKMRADDLKKLDAYKKSPEGRAAARAQASAERKEEKARALVQKLKAKRAEIEREMENDPDIEPSGGPVADMYGDQLNKIDNAIEKAASVYNKPMDYDTAVGKISEEDEFAGSDPKAGSTIKGRGFMAPRTFVDPEDLTPAAMANKKLNKEHISVGHPDNEPGMLKQDAYDIAHYAVKLYKLLKYYDSLEDQVDFPHWWQSKVVKAREYISKAAHYLEFKTNEPAIDANVDALQEGRSVNAIKKEYDALVKKMIELAKEYKQAEGDKKQKLVDQLKDHTKKKKELEKELDQAVQKTGADQELDTSINELSGDQRDALYELQNILDDVAQKGEEAREIIRQSFPRMLSKADAYGAFDLGSSSNRYDTTLASIIEEIEEYYDEEEDLDEIGMFHDPIGYSSTAAAEDKRALQFVKDLINKGVNKEDAIEKAAEKFNLRVHYLTRYVDKRIDEAVTHDFEERIDQIVNHYFKGNQELKKAAVEYASLKAARTMGGRSATASYFKDFFNNYSSEVANQAMEVIDMADDDVYQEGKYKSDTQRKAIYATKAEKGELKEFTDQTFKGSELIDKANSNAPDMFGKQIFADLLPKGVESENDAFEALRAHDKSELKHRMGPRYAPMFVHVQYHELEHEGETYRLHQRQYYNSNFKDKDPNFNPKVTEITLMKVIEKGDAKRGHDKAENLGTILVKTDVYTQDLHQLRRSGKLGQQHMEEVIKEGATCCGRCGRVHVKGTKCKRPFLTGKDHCRNN